MNVNTHYQENIAPCYLTKLPTILWSLAASYLSLKDLGRLSLTHSVFIEALSKLTDDQKELLEQCRNYPKFPHSFSIMYTDRSFHFSLPLILQLKSLTHLDYFMIKEFEQSVNVPNNSKGSIVLSKCTSLRSLSLERNPNINHLDIVLNCPNLKALTIHSNYRGSALQLASLPNLTSLTIYGICPDLNLEDLIPLISSREMTIINVNSRLPMTQKYIDALENNSSKLEHLSLSQEYVEDGQIQPLSFSSLLSKLENIKFLNLSSCDITNADLEILNASAHHLNYLFLTHNSIITLETLEKLIENLPLKQLTVLDCSNIIDENLRVFKEKKGIY